MIKIDVKSKDNFISKVTIAGHADYSESGNDIVCASVSSIAITTVNAITRINSDIIIFNEKDGFLEIEIKEDNEIINILMYNMIELFKELMRDYPQNIKVK